MKQNKRTAKNNYAMNVKIVNEAGQAVGHVNGSMMEVLDQIEVIPTVHIHSRLAIH